MTSGRWSKIAEVYLAAQERHPDKRAAFLDDACRGDDELKCEVEKLLEKDFAGNILDSPAAEFLTGSMEERLSPAINTKALSAGDKLGPYEIVGRIGAGGMGTVYKARDTRVDRIVAIKVSAAQFHGRFEREARAIAALNHPHICTMYDVGPNYLVMEYIEGKQLRGPLLLEDAVRLAVQLLDALEAAHGKGIIHRDLKPANILVSKSGVKVLDFGLARIETAMAPQGETLTQRGAIMGTLHYMSPEQVQGKELDARSDLFSFGLVLYEMLTGRRAVEAENSPSVIAAILERDPPNLQEIEPIALQRILRRCLAKDPEKRWQSAADLKAALEWLPLSTAVEPAPRRSRSFAIWGLTTALMLTGLAAGWFAWHSGPPDPKPVLEFSIAPPDGASFADPSVGPVGHISPDGRMLLGVIWTREGSSMWLRRLDSQAFVPLAQTEGVVTSTVAWSPDSRNFAFVHDGELTIMPVEGGHSRVLSEHIVSGPVAWGADGNLIATDADTHRLALIPTSGGSRRLLGDLDTARGEISHVQPRFLPGRGRYIYFAISRNREHSGTYATSVDAAPGTGGRVSILASAGPALYVPGSDTRWFQRASGWLLTVENNTLYARRFDPGSLRVTGDAVQVTDHVAWGNNESRAGFSASDDGTLVINPVIRMAAAPSLWSRDGQAMIPPFPAGSYFTPSFSHDGNRVAMAVTPSGAVNQEIWIFDLNGSTLARVASGSKWQAFPLWSPDDRNLLFVRTDGNSEDRTLYRQDVDRLGSAAKLSEPIQYSSPCGLSADGRTLLFARNIHGNLRLWTMPLDHPQDAQPLLEADNIVKFAQFSPDEHFIVFSSAISGTSEVYVQTYRAPQVRRWRISSQGGTQPRWSRDGKEIFYLGADNKLMAAPVRIKGDTLEPGVPKALFTHPPLSATYSSYQYDVSPKGDRFLFLAATGGGHMPPVRVIRNWESLLSR